VYWGLSPPWRDRGAASAARIPARRRQSKSPGARAGYDRHRPLRLRIPLNHVWKENQMKVAILDDYQNVALAMADWSPVAGRAEITVFNDHVADPDAVGERLLPFDVICVIRERTPLSRQVIERLPQLKLIASTGSRNASIDMAAAAERAI